jgi:hypothetical protein
MPICNARIGPARRMSGLPVRRNAIEPKVVAAAR